ncbi:ATP-binding protein [Neobacillus notoginsengisoli]|uniref:ATP-binding protein n=1 Tax=Neobacillus notoginsengisoli TaxID=1578198 RepID=A0A417YZL6_9BACI|nr:ATP-binding protein [Neobacillus notoginsengisoli]RHW43295.1 ATP-binding protein [Neobacillus notoginsengisoli]
MKRLVIMTVGKTHSGKTTFAHALEQRLKQSLVIDQDNHAAFINTYYNNLQPKQGPNFLKNALSNLIVDYAKKNTNFHLIICNSNRKRKDRSYLLEEVFPKKQFIRVIVYFDIPESVLEARVSTTTRSTNIFQDAYSNFKDVLARQQDETFEKGFIDPVEREADHLLTVKDEKDVENVIEGIIHIANEAPSTVGGISIDKN